MLFSRRAGGVFAIVDDHLGAVETHQPAAGADPKIAVGRLGESLHGLLWEAILRLQDAAGIVLEAALGNGRRQCMRRSQQKHAGGTGGHSTSSVTKAGDGRGVAALARFPAHARSVIDVYWSVSRMITVVETEEFLADVEGVLSEDEHDALIQYLAQQPGEGALMPGTGGLRKLR